MLTDGRLRLTIDALLVVPIAKAVREGRSAIERRGSDALASLPSLSRLAPLTPGLLRSDMAYTYDAKASQKVFSSLPATAL